MIFIEYAKCSTCKKAEKWLDAAGIPYEKRPIKENNPSIEELKKWRQTSGLPLKRFFNTSGNRYKELSLKDKLPTMSEEDQYALLASDGMLVKRPILVTDDTVLIGFKEEEWKEQLTVQNNPHMRRHDRELTDIKEIIRVIKKCDVCRLALHNDGYPYILPLNFGMQTDGKNITLYFHGANEGTKYELIKKDNRVSFEMDTSHQLVMNPEKGTCTMKYESVIGHGRIEIVPESEKEHALSVLMAQYHQEEFSYNKAVIPATTVMKLMVEQVTGKAR